MSNKEDMELQLKYVPLAKLPMKKAQQLPVNTSKSTGLITTLANMRTLLKVKLANQEHLGGGENYVLCVLWKELHPSMSACAKPDYTIRLYQNLTISLRTTQASLSSCPVLPGSSSLLSTRIHFILLIPSFSPLILWRYSCIFPISS